MATKKSEATDSSADALGAILEKLGAMDAKIEAMEDRLEESSKPPPLSVFKGEVDPYENDKVVITDSQYPNAPNLLRKNDVVAINDDTELVGLIRERGTTDVIASIEKNSNRVIGSVVEYAATHPRTGEPRFVVNIPGVGKEQVYYKDLQVVSKAR